jgi:uncharacterized protein (TIGR02118 family)
MYNVHVMYPAAAKFDLDYYMKSHMKLVETRFIEHGLTGYSVTKVTGAPGGDPTYGIMCRLEFSRPDGFRAAIKAHGDEVLGDIPNFSDSQPVIQVGEVVPA